MPRGKRVLRYRITAGDRTSVCACLSIYMGGRGLCQRPLTALPAMPYARTNPHGLPNPHAPTQVVLLVPELDEPRLWEWLQVRVCMWGVGVWGLVASGVRANTYKQTHAHTPKVLAHKHAYTHTQLPVLLFFSNTQLPACFLPCALSTSAPYLLHTHIHTHTHKHTHTHTQAQRFPCAL